MWNCQPGGAELVNYKCAGIRSWVLILAVRDGAYQPRSAPSLEEVKIFFFSYLLASSSCLTQKGKGEEFKITAPLSR